MPPSLTSEDQTFRAYAAAAFQFYARQELPDSIVRNLRLSVDPDPRSMGWMAALVATFAKRLVQSEEVSRKKSGEKTSSITFYIPPYPKRTIDYLIKYVATYIPWFNRFYQEQHDKVTTPVTVEQYDITVKEHYHFLPFEGNGHEMRWHLMSWDDDHYDGTPSEWNDLKKIRDFVENACFGDMMDCMKLQRMVYEMQGNRRRLK
jgi:hypothetical protein